MATTTNFGWETPDDTDLVKDGAAAMRTLGSAIDTSFVDLKGGTTGQVLSKASNTDMDFTWVAQDDSNAIQNAIVDAKGDLIAASAADTPARLAVGNNGETLVADSSTSTGLRYQAPVNSNPILNSAFQVWQRGTSFSLAASTPSSSGYIADRWQTATNANQACTISRQATGDTTNLPFIQYAMRYQRNSGQTGTGGILVGQNIETINSIPYAGKTITWSFYARAGANYSPTSSALNVLLYTGTGTDQNVFSGLTGSANPINSSATLTTTWQRFTYTAAIGSTVTQIAPFFYYVPTGTAGASDYFEVTGVQIEVGSVATPFKTYAGTIQGELAACQRYYQRVTGITSNSTYFSTGVAISTTRVFCPYSAPVTLRTTPSVAHSSGKVGNGVISNQSITSISAYSNGSYQQVTLDTSVGSGLTASGAFMLVLDQNAYIELSAEL